MKKSDYYEHQIEEIEQGIKDTHQIIEDRKLLLKREEKKIISAQERIKVLTEVREEILLLKEKCKK